MVDALPHLAVASHCVLPHEINSSWQTSVVVPHLRRWVNVTKHARQKHKVENERGSRWHAVPAVRASLVCVIILILYASTIRLWTLGLTFGIIVRWGAAMFHMRRYGDGVPI